MKLVHPSEVTSQIVEFQCLCWLFDLSAWTFGRLTAVNKKNMIILSAAILMTSVGLANTVSVDIVDSVAQETVPLEYGLAVGYPGDVGIESDPRVVFVEQFEEATVDDLVARWEDSKSEGISFSSDVPIGSGGSQSVRFHGEEAVDLYTRLLPGYDQLYVRYYAKIDPLCSGIHHWPWLGGHNPSTAWPWPRAGTRPEGHERWSTGVEPMGTSWAWDFYTYWMHMRTNPGGSYWGNDFNGRPSPYPANRGVWIAIELMVKMNDPVTEWNGEQAFWIDGELKSHLGPGFPRGEWIWDGFYPNDACTPAGPCDTSGSPVPCCQDFEGFQWRSDPDLNINYFWLENYVTGDPSSCGVLFDHVVIATEYIGPIFFGDLDNHAFLPLVTRQ